MNKKLIIIIAASLAIVLIGVAVVFAVHNSNDNKKNDETANDHPDKESISSETDDSETTEAILSETDDAESKETEPEKADTDKTTAETTQAEKETTPSNKEPAETKAPSKKPSETKAPSKKPSETKAPSKKPAETKPAETKPAETKPAETKPAPPDRDEPGAPDFTIYDSHGNEVHLSDFLGKPVILNFWASWCVPCKKEMPDFNEKYLEYGDEIQFLMIDFAKDDRIEDAKNYVAEMGFAFPIYFDTNGDATQAYEVIGFPTTVFIDSDGYVVDRYLGTISEETLQSGIDKILE